MSSVGCSLVIFLVLVFTIVMKNVIIGRNWMKFTKHSGTFFFFFAISYESKIISKFYVQKVMYSMFSSFAMIILILVLLHF